MAVAPEAEKKTKTKKPSKLTNKDALKPKRKNNMQTNSETKPGAQAQINLDFTEQKLHFFWLRNPKKDMPSKIPQIIVLLKYAGFLYSVDLTKLFANIMSIAFF